MEWQCVKSKVGWKSATVTIKPWDYYVKMPLYKKLCGRLIICAPVFSWSQFNSRVGAANWTATLCGSEGPKLSQERIKPKSPPLTSHHHPSSPNHVNLPCVRYLFTDCCWFRIIITCWPLWIPCPWYSSKHHLQYSKQQYLFISHCWFKEFYFSYG